MKVEDKTEDRAFATALRAAISARGLTLARLRTQLIDDGNPISMATLSYWRSGERQPEGVQSLTVVAGIEDRLGLDRGHLVSLLEPSKRVGPIAPARLPFDEDCGRRATEETLIALGGAPQDAFRDLATQLTVFVGADGAVQRIVSRSLVQAVKGTVSEIPLVDVSIGEADHISVISDVVGAELAREYVHPGRRASGVVLALDEPISVGSTALIEFTETFPSDSPRRRMAWHGTSRVAREVLIWVRFHPDALPSWCEQYIESEEGYDAVPRQIVRGKAHASRHNFGPGILGMRWGYDDASPPGHSHSE